MLDIEPGGIRGAGSSVDAASTLLNADVDADVPSCGGDAVSCALMDNLNARRRWLVQHIRDGSTQASNASQGMNSTAASYQAEDAAAATRYDGGGGSTAPAPDAASPGAPASTSSPGMPETAPLPDISGLDGEMVAAQLLAGAGPGPATAAAAHWEALAGQVQAAGENFLDAYAQIVASGESEAHPGMVAKLTRAISWTESVAGHAQALASGYVSAAGMHAATSGAVGTPADWQTLKTSLANARMENAMNGGRSQGLVDALDAALTGKDQTKSAVLTDYQTTGQDVSTVPGELGDPALDPNASGEPDDEDDTDKDKHKKSKSDDDASGGSDAIGQLPQQAMGALGKANPMQALGKAAQQLSQQAGKLGQAMKPTAPNHAMKSGAAHLPKAGAGRGGGSSPIKPASGIGGGGSGAVRPAALTGSPAASPPATDLVKPAATAPTAKGGGAGGMGMMPMSRGTGGESTTRVTSYEQPLSEVESVGRPAVVGETAKTATPVVNPEAQNAVKARLAARKKDTAGSSDE